MAVDLKPVDVAVLTVQALAWRTAEHLAKNWKSIG